MFGVEEFSFLEMESYHFDVFCFDLIDIFKMLGLLSFQKKGLFC